MNRLTITDIDGSTHTVEQSGLLFCYGDAVPATIHEDAFKIPDFGRALKRPQAIVKRLTMMDFASEARFDAAHGRRYVLLAWHRGEAKQRRIAMAAADGITNLRQYHIDCGIPEKELDAMK